MNERKVLLVDDNMVFLVMAGCCLVKAGYHVTPASDAETALKALNTSKYDLVIINIDTPPLNGFAVLEEAKRIHPSTKVIFLSEGTRISSSAEKFFSRLHADEYLFKFELSSPLHHRVNRCLCTSN